MEEPVDDIMSGQAAGLIEFLTYVKEKGLMPGRTADAWRSASQAVLSLEGDDWLSTDLLSIDVEQQVQRFANAKGGRYKPESLRTYGQRFRDSMSMYIDYLSNPTGLKPRNAGVRRSTSKRSASNKPTEISQEVGVAHDFEPADRSPSTLRLLTYPFPLKAGDVAYLQLPARVPLSDIERMCQFLRSLAIDDEG
ncbi:MAG TPA: hypothetical protein VFW71_08345 [Actinomycetota bacterium]|nr:hypothetical protein [Actinomycetota bacterium]